MSDFEKPTNRFNLLKSLFTKEYGSAPLSKSQWESIYSKNVKFIDPAQKMIGIESYIKAQEKLVNKCDDIFLFPLNVVIESNIAFVEWKMGLKIMKKEFIYEGISRIIFDNKGKIVEHRDYFDFCSSTFGPIPIAGSFFRWLYKVLVD